MFIRLTFIFESFQFTEWFECVDNSVSRTVYKGVVCQNLVNGVHFAITFVTVSRIYLIPRCSTVITPILPLVLSGRVPPLFFYFSFGSKE